MGGARWDDRITGKVSEFCRDATKIHIDVDPAEFGKIIDPDVSIAGDAKLVLKELNRLTDSKAIISTDVGQHQMWTAQFCKTNEERKWLSSGGAGTMGYGLPSAIGAQLGCRS